MAKRGQIVHSLTYPCRVIDAGIVGILRDMSQDLHERETPVFDLHRKTGFRTGGRAEDDTVDAMLTPPPHQGFLPLRQVRAIGENDNQSRRIDHRFYSPQPLGETWMGEVGNRSE